MLKDWLTIEIKFSESHLFFPRVTLIILLILGSAIIIKNLIKRYKEGRLAEFKFKFFADNYDKVKFYGTIMALFGYIFLLEKLGFMLATIIFMFLTTVLFYGDLKPRTLAISAANSIVTSFVVWFVFAYLINITLP